jgi:hypothetical protein
MTLDRLVDDFFLTDFAQRITQLWDSDPPLQMQCRLDDSSCDLEVNLGSGVVFRAHQLVLGVSFPLFNALHCVPGASWEDGLSLKLEAPFPTVIAHLVKFSYIMTTPDFDHHAFFSGILFNQSLCHVLLFSVLSYLGDMAVCDRVRSCLAGATLTQDEQYAISQIMNCYTLRDADPPSGKDAVLRAHNAIAAVLSHQLSVSHPAHFVKSFGSSGSTRGDASSGQSSFDIRYYEVADLATFFRQCQAQVDWKSGFFLRATTPNISLSKSRVSRS